MFERYTESARRALFFARLETTNFGGLAIETEHLLLGLLRESRGLIGHLFAQANLSYNDALEQAKARSVPRERASTAVQLPFSVDVKRALYAAAEEADALNSTDIAPEHLLLGLLRLDGSVAAAILHGHGMTLERERQRTATYLADDSRAAAEHAEGDSRNPDHTSRMRSEVIGRVTQLLAEMEAAAPGNDRIHDLKTMIMIELESLLGERVR